MTSEEQLDRWVAGESVHNDERDECCPDFPCCKVELLAPREEREKFRGASEDVRAAMLTVFLGRMLAAEPGAAGTKKDSDVRLFPKCLRRRMNTGPHRTGRQFSARRAQTFPDN